ncbi:MAG: primosomal protein N' [Bacteroidota bacterium]|nr:primosomal protein N' [Bacteroidota bacterium]
MSHKLANVAIPIPLTRLFTYSIPDHLTEKIHLGSIVTVPFGKKKSMGVVFEFPNNAPTISLKQIIDVYDASPSIDEENLKLTEWISDYYAAPLGETVKLFFPIGLQQSSKRIISLTANNEDALGSYINKASQSKKIFQLLQHHGSLSILQIQKKTGLKNIYAITNEMAKAGIVSIDEYVRNKPKAKKEWFFKTLVSASAIHFRGKAQQAAWNEIQRGNVSDEVSVTIFLKSNNIALSTLKSFAQKNLISLYQKEVPRTGLYSIDSHTAKSLSIVLNTYQQVALENITTAISTTKHTIFLLHGITGSGKTQVYIESIRHALQQNNSAIVLVPEISLTPQTVRRFQIHFGDLVVWVHSKMSAGERYEAWRLTKEGKYKIVIGPRSALFMPVQNLGLIVVDEEHDSSYKQFDTAPRYNARDVAVVKGSLHNAVVILGSATPSIESYANALSGKFSLLTLPERADHAVLPPVKIVNMVEERKQQYAEMKQKAKTVGRKAFVDAGKSISKILGQNIGERLQKKEGVILLQNRRGFAPFLECHDCGFVERCDRCSVTMTFHSTQNHLRCHYCGMVRQLPTVCPQCHGFQFELHGFGTQRVEQELETLFPEAKILRMDLDTTSRKNSHDKILQKFGNGEADILLGTQMVAKGLDFPRVTLVGVVSADTQMMLPDFRSAERTFQLLTQVAGRAGRSTLRGEVIIQTSQPSHYALSHVQDHNFISFYKEELEYRRSLDYPPFSRIFVIEFKGQNEKRVESCAMIFGKKLHEIHPALTMLGPAPAVLSKIKNDFRWQIILKADKEKDKNATHTRRSVVRIVNEIHKQPVSHGVKIIVDVDPAGIM